MFQLGTPGPQFLVSILAMVNCQISSDIKEVGLSLWEKGWEILDICEALYISWSSLYCINAPCSPQFIPSVKPSQTRMKTNTWRPPSGIRTTNSFCANILPFNPQYVADYLPNATYINIFCDENRGRRPETRSRLNLYANGPLRLHYIITEE